MKPRQLKREIAKRMHGAQQAAAQKMAEHMAEEVKSRIPTGGWYSIYRNAITFFMSSSGEEFVVSGLWPAPLVEFPAEATLVNIDGTEPVTVALKGWNPWPIDQIPAVDNGIPGDCVARPAGATDIEARRKVILAARSEIDEAIQSAGRKWLYDEFPVIAGRTWADIAYAARAMEHGLAGFRRIPHWVAAFRQAQNKVGAWGAGAEPMVRDILQGRTSFDPTGVKMPKGLEDAIRKRR